VNTHTHTYISMTIAIELRGGGIIICIFRDPIASVIEIIKICSPLYNINAVSSNNKSACMTFKN
jgi:hypothetical protein